MNDVRHVECTSTCRIRVLPILGAPFGVVEILELMSSFDALLCGLILSSNEGDDIVTAGAPNQPKLVAVNQEITRIRTMYLWTTSFHHRAIREERRHCLPN